MLWFVLGSGGLREASGGPRLAQRDLPGAFRGPGARVKNSKNPSLLKGPTVPPSLCVGILPEALGKRLWPSIGPCFGTAICRDRRLPAIHRRPLCPRPSLSSAMGTGLNASSESHWEQSYPLCPVTRHRRRGGGHRARCEGKTKTKATQQNFVGLPVVAPYWPV